MERNPRFFHIRPVKRADGMKWQYALHKEIPPSFEGINKLSGPEYAKVLAWLDTAGHGEVIRAGGCLLMCVDHAKLSEVWHAGKGEAHG